ncbi:MAG: 16S rRNA (cytidine(1402)-2'-O)-methyltransferase [Acidobacteriota bacterium]
MPGTLYVVATPIGNLEDVTLRALRVLSEVSVVAAEDTRRTGNLLRHYGIATPLLSLHAHNERARARHIVERLGRGEHVALVTDAGTPAVSDPGAAAVGAVRRAGYPVVPVPGPSAITALLSVAGVGETGFRFLGFPPIRSKDRKQWFARLVDSASETAIFYEAPHRLAKTLTELGKYLGNRPILLGRELTKMHEETVWGSAAELAQKLSAVRGECTLLVPPSSEPIGPREALPDEHVAKLFCEMTKTARSRREAARMVGQKIGLSTQSVYAALERAKS